MPGADLGPENPLPALQPPAGPRPPVKAHESVPEEATRYLGWGCDTGILPYRVQDGYDRNKRPRGFAAAVLENETLRATFLLDLGGRLWSLFHKPTGRELLYTNPVFQPGNLAVRNAWFAGGVEWNCGVHGHTPLTCSPLFAARARVGDGSPLLRLYEWERIRGVTYGMDFWLPDGSPVLFARMCIDNPHPHDIPMYWWSNIAVAEREDVRVVVPADFAYNHAYAGQFSRVPVPGGGDFDCTYSTNSPGAADWFFDIPEDERRWETALDGEGRGLIMTSTSPLRGRKLFVWGQGPGGKRWQEFLAQPGCRYIEIQAGVAQTQYECFPLEEDVGQHWLEAYGLMEADAARIHGADWAAARAEVAGRLEELVPRERMEQVFRESARAAFTPPEEIVHHGSGWGALEERLRERGCRRWCRDPAHPFPDASLGADQAPWLALLDDGALPERDPAELPGAWMVQDEWRSLLEEAVSAGRGDHWLSWLHLGVMRYHAKDTVGAREAWERSLALRPSAWALRSLAVHASHEKRAGDAADLWLRAFRMLPGLTPLAIECCRALVDAGRPAEVLSLLAEMPAAVRAHGRVRILEARAALDAGDLARVEGILRGGIEVPDMREGEVMLSDLWYGMHERRLAAAEGVALDDELRRRVRSECPPPADIDFRMRS